MVLRICFAANYVLKDAESRGDDTKSDHIVSRRATSSYISPSMSHPSNLQAVRLGDKISHNPSVGSSACRLVVDDNDNRVCPCTAQLCSRMRGLETQLLAQDLQLKEQLEKLIKLVVCDLCHTPMWKPRMLVPCGHVYCLSCVQSSILDDFNMYSIDDRQYGALLTIVDMLHKTDNPEAAGLANSLIKTLAPKCGRCPNCKHPTRRAVPCARLETLTEFVMMDLMSGEKPPKGLI